MENYFLFALRFSSGQDCETIYEKNFSSINSAMDHFHNLACDYIFSFLNCNVVQFDDDDSPYIEKIRVSSGDVKIYVYLQKLS